MQFTLTQEKVTELLKTYGYDIGLENHQFPEFIKRYQNKKYCILVYLTNPQKIEPFFIHKQGYGNMAAWITVDSINHLKTDS